MLRANSTVTKDTREERGKEIAGKGDQIKKVNDHSFRKQGI